MPAAPMPPDEDARLAALRSLGILDTPPDEEFEGLTRAAALCSGSPIALISLVDAHRQWFKANVGLPGVHALVSDYMMPGMNGLELIRQSRGFQPDLPGLIISGYADVTEFVPDVPNVALLRKPFQREDLIAQLAAMIARARRAGAHQPQ
jgi:CheY-like chemotaxis protein